VGIFLCHLISPFELVLPFSAFFCLFFPFAFRIKVIGGEKDDISIKKKD